MSINLNLRQQAGDTIVEVMIVLAILGLAIGISYATANRSLLDARQAQENTIATELLQSQIEGLRILASNDSSSPDYIFIASPPGQLFCVYTDASSNYHVQLTSIATPDALCRHDNLYDITIQYTPVLLPTVGGTFNIVATWPDVQGQGSDTVTQTYRYYQQ